VPCGAWALAARWREARPTPAEVPPARTGKASDPAMEGLDIPGLPKLRQHEYGLHVPRVRDVGWPAAPRRALASTCASRRPLTERTILLGFARRREIPRVDGLSDIMLSDNPRSTGAVTSRQCEFMRAIPRSA
jgi:hypothetical protein